MAASNPDSLHRELRSQSGPVAELLDEVYLNLSESERATLPSRDVGPYIDYLIEHAQRNLPRFAEKLAQTIERVYRTYTSGPRFILDYLRTNRARDAALFLDRDGQLISLIGFSWERDKSAPYETRMKGYDFYEVLTGPLSGKTFTPEERPIAIPPVYRSGIVSSVAGAASLISTLPPSVTKSATVLKVFLCHASQDKEKVRDLFHRLKDNELDPWLDEENILPGHDWDSEIVKAVRSCDVFLVCLSQASTTKRGYVQKEIRRALDVAEEIPDGRVFIIPVLLEQCAVPERLRRWQWVDITQEQGYAKLIKSLSAITVDG